MPSDPPSTAPGVQRHAFWPLALTEPHPPFENPVSAPVFSIKCPTLARRIGWTVWGPKHASHHVRKNHLVSCLMTSLFHKVQLVGRTGIFTNRMKE